jgi:P-type Mg2+ transporter
VKTGSAANDKRAFGFFIAQFKVPIILILIGATILSLFLQDRTDATLILLIMLARAILGFSQEYSATNAVVKSHALVDTKARVMRDGIEVLSHWQKLCPATWCYFPHAAIIPGDGRLPDPASSL